MTDPNRKVQDMSDVVLADLCSALDYVVLERLEGGFVRSIHPAEDLLEAAYGLARRFTQHRSPVGTALARQMMYRNASLPHPLEAHRVDSLAMFWTSIGDGKEGVAAFREKRDPEFTGRASELPEIFEGSDDSL